MRSSLRHAVFFVSAATLLVAAACKKEVASADPDTAQSETSTGAEGAATPSFENPGGMWMPTQMAAHADVLKSLGLAYDPMNLTDPTAEPLGSIVSLGGYCSASFVSPSGLLVTNHHCVTGLLQHNSTPEQNLLVDGYLAKTQKDELSGGPRGSVYVTQSVTDVTDKIISEIDKIEDPIARYDEIEKRRAAVAKECEASGPNLRCSVPSFFEGAEYYLIKQLSIQDVRVVYAPHAGVGVFGGDIDNWRWPRHTGDWSFLRAYVAPDGSSAPYSENNVPYKPPHYLKVDPKGVQKGDLVMVTGYPGRTNRLKTAGEVRNATDWMYPRAVDRYAKLLAILEEAAKADPKVAISAASIIRSLSNVLINNRGMLDGLAKGGLADTRAAEEQKLRAWIEADPDRKAKYGTVLDDIDKLNQAQWATQEHDAALGDIYNVSGLFQAAMIVREAAEQRAKKEEERDPQFKGKGIEMMAKSFESGPPSRFGLEVEKAFVRVGLESAAKLPDDQRPKMIDEMLGGKTDAAAVDKAMETYYGKTKLTDGKALAKMVRKASIKDLKRSKDPLIKLVMKYGDQLEALDQAEKAYDGKMAALRPLYIEALRKFADAPVAPDANSTLRITYGTVRGYAPSPDKPVYEPFTTISGMIAKHTGEEPFNAPEDVRKAVEAGNFGDYKHPELGEVPVDFLADLDITGGNSGSATLNARGELVGLAFDGNYEAMASDWIFMPDITRSIQVDIRYILWVMDAVDGADHLIEEMGLTPSIP